MAPASLLAFATFAALTVASPTRIERRATGTYVTNLAQCPPLPKRTSAPTTVHDLRPDDFSVVMAVGDSITAGCFAKGIQPNLLTTLNEWRGVSYAAGGDAGAITIPNLIKHYNPSVKGASVGSHGVELCFGPLCPIGPIGWDRNVDQLNSAQSGALAVNLLHEVVDYLVPQVKARNISSSAFKYLNLQIGSNDLCQLCATSLSPSGADLFETSIRAILEYIRAHIPNVVVNILGQIPVSQIYPLTLNQPYCSQLIPLPHANIECSCALLPGLAGNATRALMDNLQAQYDDRLLKIVQDYQKAAYPHFTAVWQPLPVPLNQFPIEALSAVDCFHPSQATHERIAAAAFSRLTLDAASKAETFVWDDAPSIRCLEEDDRIDTQGALAL